MRRVLLHTLLMVLLITAVMIAFLSMTQLVRSDTALDVPEATLQALAAYLNPTDDEFFSVEGEIGRAVPRRIVYSAEAELFAVVDAYNTLLLMDATTYATRFTLEPYPNEGGGYNIIDMRFSHDGRYLAFLTHKNVELWDTQTGTRTASLINPSTPRRLLGPLAFSSHDDLLIFYGEYAAPPAVRQSENDSVFYPWVWHLGAARGETPSTLPGGVQSQLMFDYGLGFALTPNDHILAVLPSRLMVLDAFTLETQYEIPTETYADDALTVFTSTDGQRVYVQAGQGGDLMRVDTDTQPIITFPSASRSSTRPTEQQIAGSRLISRGALFNLLHGNISTDRTRELRLVDFVQPLDPSRGSTLALLHITTTEGDRYFTLSSGNYVSQMTVSPDGRTLLTRESSGDEVIAVYDIESGERRYSLTPSLRGSSSYSRAQQNRVLAFDVTGATFLSDFQRFDTETVNLLAEDLRYSFSFDRFYFGRDPGTMVTISGSEWRIWDIATNTVLRREVLAQHAATIHGISPDAHRIAFWNDGGALVQDFDTDTIYSIRYPVFTPFGLTRSSSYLNPSWTRMITVYGDHPTGMYAPGGAIALTEPDQAEPVWLIAGDDLPAIISQVGWIDDDTVYVSGGALPEQINERVFGVDYAPSGLPACIEVRYPEQRETFLRLWERRLYFIPMDDLNRLALDLCAASDLSGDQVVATLAVTPTATATLNPYATLAPNTTPISEGQPPPCLFDLYTNPDERAEYVRLWQELSAAVPPEAQNELIAVICERVGNIRVSVTTDAESGSSSAVRQVMWIDTETGVRSGGSLPQTPPPNPFNPTDLILTIYHTVTERQPSAALMTADRSLLAVSNLPGELTIYRLNFDYTRAGIPGTATAIAARTAQNLIYPAVTQGVSIISTATPYVIGTARPTLTITPSQTVFPLPSDTYRAGLQDMCINTLYTHTDLPPDYAATGRIYGTFGDTGIWGIEPENGNRAPDENAPLCGYGLNCQFSPDRAWILAQTYELVYVTRPDNSDQRVLWDLRTPNPSTPFPQNLHWAAPDMLEWNDTIEVGATPTFIPVIVRDVLNVYPDPALLPSSFSIRVNEIPARVVAQQPSGLWVVLETTYGTGMGYGYRYFLHRLGTDEIIQFAQHPEYTASFGWIGYGERLYYRFNTLDPQEPEYEVLIPTGETRRARIETVGTTSPDGMRSARIFSTTSREQMIIQELETGTSFVYCLPNVFGSRSPLWSPDGRYVTWIGELGGDEEEHLFVLDTQTGSVVDLVRGIYSLITWGQEPGSYGSGAVMTPAPERDGFPTPTPPGGGA